MSFNPDVYQKLVNCDTWEEFDKIGYTPFLDPTFKEFIKTSLKQKEAQNNLINEQKQKIQEQDEKIKNLNNKFPQLKNALMVEFNKNFESCFSPFEGLKNFNIPVNQESYNSLIRVAKRDKPVVLKHNVGIFFQDKDKYHSRYLFSVLEDKFPHLNFMEESIQGKKFDVSLYISDSFTNREWLKSINVDKITKCVNNSEQTVVLLPCNVKYIQTELDKSNISKYKITDVFNFAVSGNQFKFDNDHGANEMELEKLAQYFPYQPMLIDKN